MSTGKGVWAVLGIGLLVLKLALLAGKASYRPSYSTYSPSYRSYGSYESSRQLEALEAELKKIEAEAARSREQLLSNLCASVPLEHLSVEVYWRNPQLRRIGLAARAEALGRDWPAPVQLHGLAVEVRHTFGKDDVRACAQNDAALAERVLAARALPPMKQLGAGAWLVSGERAAETLLMPKTYDALKVKGELLAFAPSDQLVAYADSADPKAIALAAQAAADLVDRSGNSGCITEDALALRKGAWVTATQVKSGPLRAAALECQAQMSSDLLIELTLTSTRTNASIDVLAAPRSVVSGKTVAALDRTGEQLVSATDGLTIDGKPVTWAALKKHAPNALVPLTLDGAAVDGFFLFQGLSEAELAKVTGTKLVAKF